MSAAAPAFDGNVLDPESAELNDYDRRILAEVENSLRNGRRLREWWKVANKANSYKEKFETAVTLHQPGKSFAFLDDAEVNGKTLPVMGDMQEMFYDHVKIAAVGPRKETEREGFGQVQVLLQTSGRPRRQVS